MENLAPLGGVYQAGTMSGNPIVMAAGLATLTKLKNNLEWYDHIENLGNKLNDGVLDISKKYNLPLVMNRVGGMLTIFFTDLKEVRTYEDVKSCNIDRFNRYFEHMLKSGFNLAPSQFEAIFLSVKHEEKHIDAFLKAFGEFASEEMSK